MQYTEQSKWNEAEWSTNGIHFNHTQREISWHLLYCQITVPKPQPVSNSHWQVQMNKGCRNQTAKVKSETSFDKICKKAVLSFGDFSFCLQLRFECKSYVFLSVSLPLLAPYLHCSLDSKLEENCCQISEFLELYLILSKAIVTFRRLCSILQNSINT